MSEDAAGMRLTANGREIRFRKSKGNPSRQMQIACLLIAKYPEGASVAELLRAAWPDDIPGENMEKLALRVTIQQLHWDEESKGFL